MKKVGKCKFCERKAYCNEEGLCKRCNLAKQIEDGYFKRGM